MRLLTFIAVAALAATALSFPAYGYCRGCVIETQLGAKALLANADASALPIIRPQCHVERQPYRRNGQPKIRRVEICE